MGVTKDESQSDIKEPHTLSREQKRFLEKIENEAKGIFQSLADKFLIEFVESDDPGGEGIKERANELNAQWCTYVKRRKLDPKALTALRAYMDDTFKEYEDSKDVNKPQNNDDKVDSKLDEEAKG